jgi:hypothetical protein
MEVERRSVESTEVERGAVTSCNYEALSRQISALTDRGTSTCHFTVMVKIATYGHCT